MKVAIHQMKSGTDPGRNTENMVRAIETASSRGAKMYFAPEMSILLDRDRHRARERIFVESETTSLNSICAAAARAMIWVHIGSVPVLGETGNGRMANRTIVIDDKGRIQARYDKMHLFEVARASGEAWRESSVYDAGNVPVIVETPLGALGLTICYDMRFPDLFSALVKSGVDVIAVPSAFTVPTGKAHWHTLLRARAIEAQAFVIAAAQAGHHEDGRVTFGHSLVIDPWGDVILDMGDGEGLGYAELDLARIAEIRSQIPVHANRREIGADIRRF